MAEIELRIGTVVNLFETPKISEDFAGTSLVINEEKKVRYGEQNEN
jgi:hypothetical protein